LTVPHPVSLVQAILPSDCDALYLSPEDEHLNEYLPRHAQRIEWLTGFSGESAPVLLTHETAYLFVDGRFHLQVDQEIDAQFVSAIKLMGDQSSEKAMVDSLKNLKRDTLTIAYDPFTLTLSRMNRLNQAAAINQMTLVWHPLEQHLIDTVWTNRPSPQVSPIISLEAEICGQTRLQRFTDIRDMMQEADADLLPVTRLDEIAWMFNLRGRDIPYNPVFIAYAIITLTEAYLFLNLDQLSPAIFETLKAEGIIVKPYSNYVSVLSERLVSAKAVWVDSQAITMGTQRLLEGTPQVARQNPLIELKAIKNEAELVGMYSANLKASRAIINHLAWSHAEYEKGEILNEISLKANLEAFYKAEEGFYDLSFPSIPGLKENSAIIHYCHPSEAQTTAGAGLYLIDSGAHYTVGGTTDTTRTTVFGQATPEQKYRYTHVLKAHIACAKAIFIEGTTGIQLDALCRAPLWAVGMEFAHGTGHGVGAFLNVHEGPNRISRVCGVPFRPGMITSIEPGYYQAGWGGIRLENLYVVVSKKELEPFQGKAWLAFDSLTYVPFERALISTELLTHEELQWLKYYYDSIYENLYPSLPSASQHWLTQQLEAFC
jgi:Xaa-Pro aminopeptidase